jgi:hypothetical protein
VRFGGQQISSDVVTTTDSFKTQVEIGNRNSASSQVGGALNRTATPVALSINTAAASSITITGQLANAGETIRLESYVIEYFHAV